jgi:hypothetical protein
VNVSVAMGAFVAVLRSPERLLTEFALSATIVRGGRHLVAHAKGADADGNHFFYASHAFVSITRRFTGSKSRNPGRAAKTPLPPPAGSGSARERSTPQGLHRNIGFEV